MKLKIFIVVLAVVLAWVAGRGIKGAGRDLVASVQQEAPSETQSGSSEQRINESFTLAEGARVDVQGVNGPVTVEAIDGDTAEVRVTSTGNSVGDLRAHQLTVEHTDSSLTIRGKGNNNNGSFWKWMRGGGEVRHTVVLRVPRRVELATRGTNGKVSIGDMEGAVRVSGVNGRVEMGRATGGAEVSGVNGGVIVTVLELGAKALKVSGVNGSVELRLGGNLNADLNANGVNGSLTVEAPNVEVQEQKRSKLRARVGTGGAEIKVNGVNGGVRIVGV